MHVLMFCPYFAPHVGGVEHYSADLNRALVESGGVERVTVVTTRLPAHAPTREIVGEGVEVIRLPAVDLIPNFPVPAFWSRRFWLLAKSLQTSQYDAVVSHTRFFVTSLLALAYARAGRLRWLHIEHGSDFVQLAGRLPTLGSRAYDWTLGRLVLRSADEVVAISHAAAGFIQRLAGRRAEVVHRGVRPEAIDAVPAAPGGSELVVAFLGRLIDGKGVQDLIEAFSGLAHNGASCWIIGDGPRRAELEGLAESLGEGTRIRFLGSQPWEDAVALLKTSAVLVNPSYTEGLPTSIIEAALARRAIVATDVGGTGEIIEDGVSGRLVPPRDIASLREAISALLSDEALRVKLGERAREDVVANFSWDACAARLVQLARGRDGER